MYFYILLIPLCVTFASAQNRQVYVASRPLGPLNGGGTVEYLSPEGAVKVIGHYGILFGECGPESPHWKLDSIKPLGILIELYKDNGANNVKITHDFRPRQADGWIFAHAGTTRVPVTNEELNTAGIAAHCFSDIMKLKIIFKKTPNTLYATITVKRLLCTLFGKYVLLAKFLQRSKIGSDSDLGLSV